MAFDEHFGQLVAHTLAGNLMDPGSQLLDRAECLRLDGVTEPRGKAHRAQHAQLVFGETQSRIADGADDFGSQILLPADVVENFVRYGIEQQAVDSEVAALDIFPSALAEAHPIGVTAVAVADVRTESGDFNTARPG